MDNSPVLLKVLNKPYPTLKLLAPLWQEFEILRGLDLPGVEKAYALENHEQWWMIVIEDINGQPLSKAGHSRLYEARRIYKPVASMR